MNVVNYLKSNSLEKLKSQYSIKVKEYPENGLIVLNYTNPSPEKSPIVKECRGLILSSDYEIVSRGFDRFFNYNEKSAAKPNMGAECYATEKIDGSLIKLYKFNGKWCISTRGTAFAECIIYESTTTYQQAIFEALNIDENGFQEMCENWNLNDKLTYILELTGKCNRVLTEYNPNKYELWFISARSNDFTGKYIDVNSIKLHKNIRRPKIVRFRNMMECIRQAEKLTNLREGFVVFDQKTFEPTYKIKSPTYVRMHSAISIGKGIQHKRHICKMIVANESSEFIAYFPKYTDSVNECYRRIRQYFDTIQIEFENLTKTMKSEFDFGVFSEKSWYSLATIALKTKRTNLYDYFMSLDDEQRQIKYIMAEIIKD